MSMDVIFNVVAGTIIICVLVLDLGGTFFFSCLGICFYGTLFSR